MFSAPQCIPGRLFVIGAGVAGLGLLLMGCTSSAPQHRATPSSTAHVPNDSAAPSTPPTPSATSGTSGLSARPFSMPCATLAPAKTIAGSYAGMSLDPNAAAPRDSDAQVIAGYGGTSCTWKNGSGQSMTLAVGTFDDDSITKLKNTLITLSNPVPTYRGEGYFQLADGSGIAEAFSGSHWIVAISNTFGEPGAAEPLVDAAISALPAH